MSKETVIELVESFNGIAELWELNRFVEVRHVGFDERGGYTFYMKVDSPDDPEVYNTLGQVGMSLVEAETFAFALRLGLLWSNYRSKKEEVS